MATTLFEVAQLASAVTLRLLPSGSIAVALSWTLCPTAKRREPPAHHDTDHRRSGCVSRRSRSPAAPDGQRCEGENHKAPQPYLRSSGKAASNGSMEPAGAVRPLHNVPGQIQHDTPPWLEHVPERFCEQLRLPSSHTAVA